MVASTSSPLQYGKSWSESIGQSRQGTSINTNFGIDKSSLNDSHSNAYVASRIPRASITQAHPHPSPPSKANTNYNPSSTCGTFPNKLAQVSMTFNLSSRGIENGMALQEYTREKYNFLTTKIKIAIRRILCCIFNYLPHIYCDGM